MLDFSDFKCRFISNSEIRQIADNFHKEHWGKNDLPVDIELIIEKIGLEIIPKDISETIDAYLKIDARGIIVNTKTYCSDSYVNRLRFSLAHETGHYVLHKSIIHKLQFKTINDYYNFIENAPEDEYNNFEYQANEFAGRLLVPQKRLKLEIEKVYEILKENKMLFMLDKDPEQVLSRISPQLCKPFGVSEAVVEIRAKRENLWPPILE